MLKSFKIENFNSIKDPVLFTMVPDFELTEQPDFWFDKERLLKVASIYGPNGTGKSNVLFALRYLKNLVTGVFIGSNAGLQSNAIDFQTFAFTEDRKELTKLSSVFVRDGIEYFYDVVTKIVEMDPIKLEIVEESLKIKRDANADLENIFTRVNNKIDSKELNKALDIEELNVPNSMTVLAHVVIEYVDFLIDYEEQCIKDVHLHAVNEFFEEISAIIYFNKHYVLSLKERQVERIFKNRDFIIKSLNNLDIQISDIIMRKNGSNEIGIVCLHEVNGKNYEILLEKESKGTKLLINLLARIANREDRHTIFVIDELDSHLHPKLIKEIIRLFNSDSNLKNQLLFNSHDMINMNLETLRRDQIWFTRRDEFKATNLVCLGDIVNEKGERVRKDAKYSKQYLEGKYGSLPNIKEGLKWNN